jgi:hypothetical protein
MSDCCEKPLEENWLSTGPIFPISWIKADPHFEKTMVLATVMYLLIR